MRLPISILVLAVLMPVMGVSQSDMPSIEREGVPEFYYDLVNVASIKPEYTRLNLYIEIPYDELQFLKNEEAYVAEYEVTAVLYDKDGEQVDGKIWQEKVSVDDYELTNSRNYYHLTNAEFHLKPAEVRVSIGVMDMESKKTGFRKTRIELKDFSVKKIGISDLTFTDNIELDSLGLKSIHPQVADYIKAAGDELYCYFELYSQLKKDHNFEISYELKNSKNQKIQEQNYLRRKDDFRTMEYFTLDKTLLTVGKYSIDITVKAGRQSDTVSKTFILRWAGAPSSVADLNLAIEQLKYIAKNQEVDKIKKAPEDEKFEKFREFWKEKDPSPGTEKNELMNEYYARVEYANENYSGFKEGWKTDMGMIYIIFGAPSDIERHPFERNYKPYEVWYYYHINRQFVFVDETGFGEYRLANPYNWRTWNEGIYY